MEKKKIVLLILVVIVIIGAIFVLQRPAEQQAEQTGIVPEGGTKIGEVVKDLELKSLDGGTVKFSDFRGNILVLNAWAGWCPFCIDEMPDLQRASNKRDDVVVLFIHRTRTEDIDTALTYLDDFPEKRGIEITDPILLDEADLFYREFFGFGMPVTLFVDKNGLIRDRKVGPLTVEEIDQKIEAIE